MSDDPQQPGSVERLGLVAGNGRFPVILAQNARRQGVQVVAVALEGETLPELEQHVDSLHWASIAKLGKVIRIFQQEGVTKAVMAGGVTKAKLYQRFTNPKLFPDLRAVSVLYKRARDNKDHTLLAAVADEFASEGIHFQSTIDYMDGFLADVGCMTRRAPSAQEMEDVEFGWPLAKAIAEMQIGQSIVVKDKCVVAVEAVEGTDDMLRRGGALARGQAVAIKVCRPNQDFRFDVPTIGPLTVDTLSEAGISALAVDAGKTIMLDKPELLEAVDAKRIAIVGRAPDSGRPQA